MIKYAVIVKEVKADGIHLDTALIFKTKEEMEIFASKGSQYIQMTMIDYSSVIHTIRDICAILDYAESVFKRGDTPEHSLDEVENMYEYLMNNVGDYIKSLIGEKCIKVDTIESLQEFRDYLISADYKLTLLKTKE